MNFLDKLKRYFFKSKNVKKYTHIVMLGNNCETAYQFYKNFKFVPTNMFTWAAIPYKQEFIDLLLNLDDIFTDGVSFHGDIGRCKKYKVGFHFHS